MDLLFNTLPVLFLARLTLALGSLALSDLDLELDSIGLRGRKSSFIKNIPITLYIGSGYLSYDSISFMSF